MLRQTLSQKMLQKLSPQQIQLMKLLQVPTATLEERIKEELEANPALEVADNYQEVFDLNDENRNDRDAPSEQSERDEEVKTEPDYEMDDYLMQYLDDDPTSYKLKDDFYQDEADTSLPVPVEVSFLDELHKQVGLYDWHSEQEEIIANQIVGSIDDDGYLRREISALVDDLMFSQNIEVNKEEILSVLRTIQTFDPPGVAARDLQECLILQLKFKIKKDLANGVIDEIRQKALIMLSKNFEEFIKKHFNKLRKIYELSDSELKEIIDEIIKLNPKPASSIQEVSNHRTQYIIPDFLIYNKDGELELVLNSKNAPDLKISDQFAEMLMGFRANIKAKKVDKKSKEAILFIKQKIDSARWFIDAIKQRQDTLYRTMYAILQFQYEYFLTGDDRRLKPMILKDIAEVTGLDISTVSRVANSKFVQTEYGSKRLKDFFSESVQTTDGKEVSTFQVKNILEEILKREDKRNPYSDEKLKEMLNMRGYDIARRTIAKYREMLNIPVARLRKEL